MPSSTVHRNANGAYIFDNGDVFIERFFGLGNTAAPETGFPWQISNNFAFVSGSSAFGFAPLSYYPSYDATPANLTALTDGITNLDFECITTFNNKDISFVTNFYNYLEMLGSGTIDEAILTQYGSVVAGTRNVGENYCLLMQSGHFGTGGTITEDVTVVVQTPAHGNGGTMTTHIGLEIEDQQFGTNSWAVKSAGGRWELDFTTPILTGGETYTCFFVDITNANHTGATNFVYGIYIDGITFDAQANTTAIKIGSGGWTYAIEIPTSIGIAFGNNQEAQLLYDGTNLEITGLNLHVDASVLSGGGFATDGGNFGVDETGAMSTVSLEIKANGFLSVAATSEIGFFGATPAAQQTSGADLTNNVTSGGTNDTIADYSSLTVYATDAAAIRNNIYQLARKLKQVNDALRVYGILS